MITVTFCPLSGNYLMPTNKVFPPKMVNTGSGGGHQGHSCLKPKLGREAQEKHFTKKANIPQISLPDANNKMYFFSSQVSNVTENINQNSIVERHSVAGQLSAIWKIISICRGI